MARKRERKMNTAVSFNSIFFFEALPKYKNKSYTTKGERTEREGEGKGEGGVGSIETF